MAIATNTQSGGPTDEQSQAESRSQPQPVDQNRNHTTAQNALVTAGRARQQGLAAFTDGGEQQ